MKATKFIFAWSGFGNYSTCFGWDNGLSVSVQDRAFNIEEWNESLSQWEREHTGGTFFVHENVQIGSFDYYNNDHGGSRNLSGWICATSVEDAQKILNEWAEENFPVVEYER